MVDYVRKMKHLDFIQLTITRMAANSFLLKAWSAAVLAGIFAFAARDAQWDFIYVALVPLIAFWVLDGYYLQQERRFRALYDRVRLQKELDIDFDLKPPVTSDKWLYSMFNKTELIFYGGLIVSVAIITYIGGK